MKTLIIVDKTKDYSHEVANILKQYKFKDVEVVVDTPKFGSEAETFEEAITKESFIPVTKYETVKGVLNIHETFVGLTISGLHDVGIGELLTKQNSFFTKREKTLKPQNASKYFSHNKQNQKRQWRN